MQKDDLIFIVEDDSYYASLLKSFLELRGFTDILVLNSGEECLENLYRCPKLILLDYNLGNTLGKAVLNEVMVFNPNIPVVVVSGQSSIQSAIDLLKIGAFEYIQKSDEVFTKLESILTIVSSSQKEKKDILRNQNLKKGLAISSLFGLFVITTFLMLKL